MYRVRIHWLPPPPLAASILACSIVVHFHVSMVLSIPVFVPVSCPGSIYPDQFICLEGETARDECLG